MPDITDPLTLSLLFILALVAGCIDSMAGGGGLLTVPGLLATGLDPILALATNKCQGTLGTSSAVYRFWRSGKVDIRKNLPTALVAFFAGMAGAASLTFIDPNQLKTIIPFLLMAIGVWILLKPSIGEQVQKEKIKPITYLFFIAPIIGFYDGFLGPGAGSFFTLSLVFFLGYKLDDATARAKVLNMMSNFGPLLFFIVQGKVIWPIAMVMAGGALIGSNIGARLVIKHGTALVRPLLVIVSFVMSVKLLSDNPAIKAMF